MADNYSETAQKVRDRKRKAQKNQTFVSEGGDEQLNNQLAAARNAVGSQVKTFIIAGGIQDALSDIAKGDFGVAANDAIALLNSTITTPLEVEVELMQESFNNSKNLLMPSQASST